MIGREHGGNDVSDYILIALLTVVGCLVYCVLRAVYSALPAQFSSALLHSALHCSLSTITDRPTDGLRDRQTCRLLVCCNSDFVLRAASGSSFVLLRVSVVSLSSLPLPLTLLLLLLTLLH